MTHTEELEAYVLAHIDQEGDYLASLYRATHLKLLRPRMVSGHLQGRILKMLIRMVRPKTVLEIGSYSGYSGLCMAEGLSKEGKLYTFEINDEQEDFTRPWFENSPYKNQIEFIIGDAMQLVPKLGISFDFVFIDGDKRHYLEYYEMAMQYTSTNAYIVVDNTLWDGHLTDPAYNNDPQTVGVCQFNNFVATDNRVEKVILPLRDGLTLIRKL